MILKLMVIHGFLLTDLHVIVSRWPNFTFFRTVWIQFSRVLPDDLVGSRWFGLHHSYIFNRVWTVSIENEQCCLSSACAIVRLEVDYDLEMGSCDMYGK